MAKEYKTIAAAQKAGSMYYTGKDGKKKLAVTKEELDAWKKKNKGKYKGSALTAWANAKGKDIKGGRDSSPRPKLRPGSESAGPGMGVMTKAEKDEVAAANKRTQEAREEKAGTKKRTSAGQKFNAWYEKNGDKYSTMKEAMEAYQGTLKSGMSYGGMTKKKKTGMSYGGMAKKKMGMNKGGMANCGASMKPNRMSRK